MAPYTPLKPADLFALIAPTLKKLKVDYAVGGAVAMAAHGYVRDTTDLDVFFKSEDANKVLSAFRKKFRVGTFMEPYHYAIQPDLREPDVRVDLLFTSDDLERDAVEFPDRAQIVSNKKKLSVDVFPLDVLVAAKLVSDRTKDHADVLLLYQRGLFEPKKVRLILEQNEEPIGIQRLDMLGSSPVGKRRRR